MDTKKDVALSLPPFDAIQFHQRLELLRLAFEAKGHHVSPSLLPAVQELELRERCSWFPTELPEELVALYAWRGGQANDAWDEEFPFCFRDCAFSGLGNAEQEYKSMMQSSGSNPEDHYLLKYSFPFAAFNGGWLVLPCKEQSLDRRFKRPVISVFQGIDVWFYSMELMIETCIEWVSHPKYAGNDHLQGDEEMEIWKRHNPGIFGR
jgi:hypothetical protein